MPPHQPPHKLTLLAMVGTLGMTASALAQQPPASPPVAPTQTAPAVPVPTVAPPVAPTQPAPVDPRAPAVTLPVSPPTPVVPPVTAPPTAVPSPEPPAGTPQQNGAVPPGAAPGTAVPEVVVVQPPPAASPKAKAGKSIAAKANLPVRAAAPAPAPPPAGPTPQPVAGEAAPTALIAAAPVANALPGPASQVKVSPVGGSEIAIEKVAGSVSTVSAADIAQSGSGSLQDVLQAKVPGIIISDLQGNGAQTDVQYRGFSASPVDGVPQGLAIYQNGVRINEAFGDTVNLDFLPSNAINDVTVMSNNPAFGLNAIGGSISIGMKDGFSYHGGEIDGRVGSFARRQGAVQAGMQAGSVAAYFAFESSADRGWRDNSPTNIKRFYGDIGFKGDDLELMST